MGCIRTAVIGVGYLGRFHAQKYAALPEARLIGIADTDAAACSRVAQELGVRGCSDYHELLGQVEAVSIVTPTAAHAAIATDFLAAGAHVLVEKPIAVDVAEAEALIRRARERGRILQVGHLERFNPVVVGAEPYLRAPRFIECHRLAPFRERGTDVDVVLDLMIHDIDLLQSIVGSDIVALDAVGTPVFSRETDIANARIHFASGCVANATASRVSLKTERKLRIFQDDAYLSLDLQQKILTLIRRRAMPADDAQLPVTIEEQSFEQGDALLAEIQSFLRAVRGAGPVAVSGEDGLRALRTAIAISEALRAGGGREPARGRAC